MRGWNGPKTLSKEKAQTPTSLRDLETMEQSQVFERPAGAQNMLRSGSSAIITGRFVSSLMRASKLRRRAVPHQNFVRI
jgi:hypothetical protein